MNTNDRLRAAASLQQQGQYQKAQAIYLQILAQDPGNIDAKHLLGLIRGEQDREVEAVALINEAIAAKPNEAAFHHNIAGIYRRMGRLEEAENEFRKAIQLKVDYGEAYQGLAEVVRFESGDPLIEQTISQVQRLDLDDRVKSYFYFAAGKMHDDCGNYDTAFHCYQQGNNLSHRAFDTNDHRSLIKDTIYVFSEYYFRGRPIIEGLDTELPVFIVGMPRSGTSLIEQILASHSEVYGAGELNEIKRLVRASPKYSQVKAPYPYCIPLLKSGSVQRLAGEYLNHVKGLARKESISRIIDKHPLNFLYVGLILRMFPNARIIHSRRDPLDTCLSCFFQNFTRGQNYSFNLIKLAHFYNDYQRVMEHWQQLCPDRIYLMDYEKLVANAEEETKRLIDFCGLGWEDACLEFYETRRIVKTASFMQVRQPIYDSSVGRWHRYAKHLQPLAQILGVKLQASGQ